MSKSTLQWDNFITEAIDNKRIWTICDENGFPAPINSDGERAMPFWSSPNRIENIIKGVPAYSKFQLYEITLEVFKNRWLKGMIKDKLKVGINWSGATATGFDIEPEIVLQRLEFEEKKLDML